MRQDLLEVLACPECLGELSEVAAGLICDTCKQTYPELNGIPHFINYHEIKDKPKSFGLLRRLFNAVPTPKQGFFYGQKKIIANLIEEHKDALVINLGAGSKRLAPKWINVDIFAYPGVDVVADVQKLPFKSGTVQGVYSNALMEHVENPFFVAREMLRVMGPYNSFCVCWVPFIYNFHAAPNDYSRFTKSGIISLFNELDMEHFYVGPGPASSLSCIIIQFFAILFSCGRKKLYSFFVKLFSWIFFPLKYLDILFTRNQMSHLIASGFLFIGKRGD